MAPLKLQMKMKTRNMAGSSVSLHKNDTAAAGISSGIGIGLSVVGILIALLIFAAVAPSIGGGLNNTSNAFVNYAGVGGLIGIIPILLVVVILVAIVGFAVSKHKGN